MNRRQALVHAAVMAIPITASSESVKAPALSVPTHAPLLKRQIPSSGEWLPVIGLGTWQTFDVGSDEASRAPLEAVLREFAARGGSMIDSSPMYGRSEAVLGDLVAAIGLRESLFLATKIWTTGKAAGIAQAEASLAKMRVGSRPLDLLQVHNLVDVETHLATLNAWKREKRIRYTGITHYTPSAYDAVAKVLERHSVDFLQINYSIGEREAERRLLPLAKERGVAVIVNRPFAGGDLLRRLNTQPLPSFAREVDCKSWAQLLLKFVLSEPSVTVAIPGTSKPSHVIDNLAAGADQLPDPAMRARIAALAV